MRIYQLYIVIVFILRSFSVNAQELSIMAEGGVPKMATDLQCDTEGTDCNGTGIDESSNKRKGSPLSSNEPKKQVSASVEGVTLRRRNSLSDLSKLSATDRKKLKPKTMAFSEMMKVSFDDQSFRESVTPILYDMICPMIEETIKATVSSTVTAAINSLRSNVIDDMIQSNRNLQESVRRQNEIINAQKETIEKQESIINEKNALTEDLECQVNLLSAELDDLRFSVNDLEQYGRRN